ncbi:Marine sediment metagenome DNA, contig: S01H1_S24385 (Fragment) OS=marine sediment metagenome GN=S01H1_59837 PE=4 SV=1: ParBc [Gemmata massiliana]|uniref:ParB-like N-terminal domain-containing protein n=1 Tax=Gemmata massiliana TaxID=1210884 RepID=A0A6P2D183_9BACT
MLHPIVLNTRFELIAGARRLTAAQKLGWKEIPCRVLDTLDDAVAALQTERDENTCREPWALDELVEVGRRIEKLEKPNSDRRKKAGRGTEPSGKFPDGSTGDTRDKVGSALGMSGKTYEKGKKVSEAAEKEPEKYGDLPALANSESIDAAYKELKRRQKQSTSPPPPPVPPLVIHTPDAPAPATSRADDLRALADALLVLAAFDEQLQRFRHLKELAADHPIGAQSGLYGAPGAAFSPGTT